MRPVIVTLNSVLEARDVLKNKYKYSGPVKISQGSTSCQRAYLQSLRKKLQESNDSSLTIRYVNGKPVLRKIASSPKNEVLLSQYTTRM